MPGDSIAQGEKGVMEVTFTHPSSVSSGCSDDAYE